MKKIFKLENLECANCAAKIQDGISGLDGVDRVSVNFMTTKLIIEAEEHKMEGIIKSAQSIIKKYEPDVIMQKA